MIIYTITYTQSDPVTINQIAKPSKKFRLRTPGQSSKEYKKVTVTKMLQYLHQTLWITWYDCQSVMGGGQRHTSALQKLTRQL